MVVEKGYKQTEVGVIPEDWDIKYLGELTQGNPDYGIGAAAVAYNDTLPTYLRITDISDDGQYISSIKTSVKHPLAVNYFLKNNEIVVARTGASVGKTYLHKASNGKLVFAGFLIRVKPNEELLNPFFLFGYTQSYFYKNWIVENSMRSGQPGINSQQLRQLPVPVPSLKEQTAIAEALSDMDALISSLEQQIEKKKAIKQGMMQELLKPKEGWVTKKLGEIVKTLKSGGTPPTSIKEYYNGDISFLSIADMTSQGKYLNYTSSKISEHGLANSSSWLVPRNHLIYSMYASVGFVSITKIDMAISQAVLGIKFIDDIDMDFMYYLLCSMQKSIVKFVGEGTQKNLNAGTVRQFDISYPTKDKQTEISKILSEVDEDIAVLTHKLNKILYNKQAMMQSLLTGKIRLA